MMELVFHIKKHLQSSSCEAEYGCGWQECGTKGEWDGGRGRVWSVEQPSDSKIPKCPLRGLVGLIKEQEGGGKDV